MDDTPHHLSNNTAETPPPLTSGNFNPSHYYIVQISEYDAMKAEIERLRTENAAMRRQALQNMIQHSENAGIYNLH